MVHPCLECGACCATYRVAFHWTEADPGWGGKVPPQAVATWDPHRVALRGTDRREPRCEQLVGQIGKHAQCGIYALRPSPCRDLVPAWENGQPSPQCDRARIRHGLAPLAPATWEVFATDDRAA